MTKIFSKDSAASDQVSIESKQSEDATPDRPEDQGEPAPPVVRQDQSTDTVEPISDGAAAEDDQVAVPGMIMGSFLVTCAPLDTDHQLLDCLISQETQRSEIYDVQSVEILLADGRSVSFDRQGYHQHKGQIFISLPVGFLEPGPVTVIVHVEGLPPAIVTENLTVSERPSESEQADTPFTAEVEAYFPVSGSRWNDYVATDKYSLSMATDTACSRSDALKPDECLHAGEVKKITMPESVLSCDGLVANDALNAFNWSCENPSDGPVYFHSSYKKENRLTRILDENGFFQNYVVITKNETIVGQSTPAIWWPNQVKALTTRSGGETMMIPFPEDETGTVYVITESAESVGIELVRSKTTLLVADQATLTLSSSVENNCEDKDASQSDANSKCLIFSDDEAFLWIEGQYAGSPQSDFIVNGHKVKYSNFRNLSLSYSNRHAVRLSESYANLFENTQISSSSGINFEKSYGNRFNHLSLKQITGHHGIYLLESGKNLFFHSTIHNSNLESAIWLLGEESEKNTFSDLHISGNILYGIRMGVDSDYSRVFGYESTMVKIPVFIESSHDNTLQSLRFSQGVTGIAIQSGSYKNTVINAGIFDFSNEALYFNGGTDNQIMGAFVSGQLSNLCRLMSNESPSVNNFCSGNSISAFQLQLEQNRSVNDLDNFFGPLSLNSDQCQEHVYPLITIPSGKTILMNAIENIDASALTQNFNGLCEPGEKCLFIDQIGIYPEPNSASTLKSCQYLSEQSDIPGLSFQVFGMSQ